MGRSKVKIQTCLWPVHSHAGKHCWSQSLFLFQSIIGECKNLLDFAWIPKKECPSVPDSILSSPSISKLFRSICEHQSNSIIKSQPSESHRCKYRLFSSTLSLLTSFLIHWMFAFHSIIGSIVCFTSYFILHSSLIAILPSTQEMASLSRSSPQTPRLGSLIKNHQQMLQQQQMQETSFTNPTSIETDATVAKINTMFPTASEHHIRLLLKK